MNIFQLKAQERIGKNAPLAERMRPLTIDEFVGQEKILGQGRQLRHAIMADQLKSAIFYGPPGTGKTTLARIIANSTSSYFESLNAVTSGVADIRRITSEASVRIGEVGQRTLVFIDEIHRFNKGQQDALLPAVEKGLVVLIGATTENPFFSVNAPLLSRSRVFKLEPLTSNDLHIIAKRALTDVERGLGEQNPIMSEEVLQHLVNMCGGDARALLNALELAVGSVLPNEAGKRLLTLHSIEEAIGQRAVVYDKAGDKHYHIISAFIKSMRGSDPDGALYWLAAMVNAGEDPRYIARRMMICASEDIGLADPRALQIAVAAAQAVEFLGMPEGRIPLSQAVVYLATAPKSNSAYLAIEEALAAINNGSSLEVPKHLRDASYSGAKTFGYGQGYQYPHDFPGHFVKQSYLPHAIEGSAFYRPTDQGYERTINERLAYWKTRRNNNTSVEE
ncbi:MAG: replication-associated recombination protein A [bacterium]|nr:replication-associated recombination protein A [bacterium]